MTTSHYYILPNVPLNYMLWRDCDVTHRDKDRAYRGRTSVEAVSSQSHTPEMKTLLISLSIVLVLLHTSEAYSYSYGFAPGKKRAALLGEKIRSLLHKHRNQYSPEGTTTQSMDDETPRGPSTYPFLVNEAEPKGQDTWYSEPMWGASRGATRDYNPALRSWISDRRK
ncbi:uncharacterized protein LOC144868629 [Branchiostoma floridae x Branchiostoma japonicum]